jgi:hypothetical protein
MKERDKFIAAFRKFLRRQGNGEPLGEVPDHALGVRSESPETDNLLENGYLEKVGEIPQYIDRPTKGIVVKRAAKVAGIAATGAIVALTTYEAIKLARSRREKAKKTTLNNPEVSSGVTDA